VGRLIAERGAALIAILLALLVIVFLLESVIPADPVRAMVGASATRESVAAKRHQLGLDKPLPEQFVQFLGRAVRGDLSLSLHTRRPVRDDLAAFLPATIELALAAAFISAVLGLGLGVLTARGGGTSLRVLLVSGASVPGFLLAIVFLLVFYSGLHWFPGSGRLSSTITPPSGPTKLYVVDGLLHGRLDVVVDALQHLVLPAVCLALAPAVAFGRVLRSSLQTVLAQDHIRTARAKALPERRILFGHALRSSLNAPLTMAGLQVGMLLAGVVVIETAFAWPGIGLYTVQSIASTDFPAVAGVTLVLGAAYVVINALVDVGQLAADPRLRTA